MSINPLHELKRRLEDDTTPLPKRMCLAKNVIHSQYFPTAPKERVVAEWLISLQVKNELNREVLLDDLKQIDFDNTSGELKNNLIQILSEYLHRNPIEDEDIPLFLSFIENEKINPQMQQNITAYMNITVTVLQYLKETNNPNKLIHIQQILKNIQKYYSSSKKKIEFIIKLLQGENIETIFSFLHTDCHDTVLSLCSNVLFPINKKSFFTIFLQTLIRKESIDELMAEKGDNIQSVLKVMSCFFTFPNGRSFKDPKFLSDFIEVFISSFHENSQIIFAFFIMVTNSLNMDQSYISPAMKMPTIIFDKDNEKAKRNLFLKMLEILLKKEVDITVRLTDTFGEKISKVEIKKNFTAFLQVVMMGQLKLEGKLDKTTLQIIKTALKLDPLLIEAKLEEILPPLMIAKKNSSSVLQSYKDMLNCLIETQFKLSRGIFFINQLLPNLKQNLEAFNTEQFELKQKVKDCTDSGLDCEKLKTKIINGSDVFPQECVDMYGKCTSELLFRQNGELMLSLQKDLEENCLMMLEEGFISPSIIVMTEMLTSILCSYFEHSKMADHTVPQQIATNFWGLFKNFEEELLKKFGECILKLNYNPPLVQSFLKLCLSYSHLKLLNINYSNIKLQLPAYNNESVFDLGQILPCLNSAQWLELASRITDDDTVVIMDELLLNKSVFLDLFEETSIEDVLSIRNHLIKQMNVLNVEYNRYYSQVLIGHLEKSQAKHIAKYLMKQYFGDGTLTIFLPNNRVLLNALIIETSKNLLKCFNSTESLAKAMNKAEFDFPSFIRNIDVKDYFSKITLTENQEDHIMKCLELFKMLKIPYLDEVYQLTAIFVLLCVKKCCHNKKIKRQVDNIFLSIFELSSKYPDIYKIFPINLIFGFEEENLLNLLTLKIKTTNQLLVVKSVLESAVKKVKTDSDIIKNIVKLLINTRGSKKDTSIDYFNNPVFQITCLLLPLIAKEKKAITTSNYRSILANLQEELLNKILEAFQNVDFTNTSYMEITGNPDDSVISDSMMATLNAMDAFSLTLLKYCESNNAEEIKKLDCLWSGLEFFIQNAIQAIQNVDTKYPHILSSIQLLNVTLRYIKKLDTHKLFAKKDELFVKIWQSLHSRLFMVYDDRLKNKKGKINYNCSEEIATTVKFLCELSSLECFSLHFVGDLTKSFALKDPSTILKDEESNNTVLTAHKVTKYLITQYLKANIVGPKCVAITKLIYNSSKKLRSWIQEHYEKNQNNIASTENTSDVDMEIQNENEQIMKTVHIDDAICEIVKLDLDCLSLVVMAAKKISLDYKFLDCIFELQQLILYILGCKTRSIKCEISWQSFFGLFGASLSILNSLLMSREEILEDRWPNYMQCYRTLTNCLCDRSTSNIQLDREVEEKLADLAHAVEKLTQSMCKRKTHISRLAAYTVADVCTFLANTAPTKMVRQHIENSVAMLIQASDSNYCTAFLRRALAGSPAQLVMTRLYTMYKRYHKYVGNS